jgi:hypothetical protein
MSTKKTKLESTVENTEAPAAPAKETKPEPAVSKSIHCGKCNFSHTDNFDGPGIGHWPFEKGSESENQFYFYCREPKVSIYVPLDSGEKMTPKSIPLITPQVNGLKIGIVKGHYIEVPKSLADIIKDSLNQTSLITSDAKTAPNPYTGAINSARLDLRDDGAKNALNA